MPQDSHIPDRVESVLRESWGSHFDRVCLEALVSEAYRRGDVSIGFCGEVLGLGTVGALNWMHERGVHQPPPTSEEIRRDAEVIHQVLQKLDQEQRSKHAS